MRRITNDIETYLLQAHTSLQSKYLFWTGDNRQMQRICSCNRLLSWFERLLNRTLEPAKRFNEQSPNKEQTREKKRTDKYTWAKEIAAQTSSTQCMKLKCVVCHAIITNFISFGWCINGFVSINDHPLVEQLINSIVWHYTNKQT